LLEKIECGVVLTGTEAKSSAAASPTSKIPRLVKDGELWLLNAHIALRARQHPNMPPAHRKL